MTRRPVLVALIAASALAALSGSATAQNTTKSSSTNSCPSQQTVMTSDWYGSSKGYLCAQEYHDGNVSVDAGASDTFSTATNVNYFPQYYCWDSSDDKEFTYSHAEIFGSGSVTATNWGTGSHVWGAGYLYTLGSGSVTGWTNGCYDNSQVWQYPPDLLQITSITAKNLPDNGQSKAGVKYTINVTASPMQVTAGAQVVIQDNGVSVALATFDENGNAVDSKGNLGISWIPAKMGARNIQAAWPGADGALGNITDAYTVNVAGGLAATVASPIVDNGNGTATATVQLDSTPDPFPASGTVVLIDATTQTGVGKAALVAPASGTTTSIPVTFKYTGGQSYNIIAQVQDPSSNVLAQSYVTPFRAPTVVTPTFPGTIYASLASGQCQTVTVPTTIQPTSATGAISFTTTPSTTSPTINAYPQNGTASGQWCPPTTPGTYTVTTNYAGDSTSYPASTSTQVTVLSGGPTVSITSPTMTSSSKCQVTIGVNGVVSGANAVKLWVGQTPGAYTSTANGTLSGSSAKVSFNCMSGLTYYMQAQYLTPAQMFSSQPTQAGFVYKSGSSSGGWSMSMSRDQAPGPKGGASPVVGTGPVVIGTKSDTATPTQRKPRKPVGNRGTASAGDLTPVNIGLTSRSRRIKVTSNRRSISLKCPARSYPLNADAGSRGPDTDFAVSFSGRTATITSGEANVGQRMSASVLCRAQGSRAQVIGPLGYGTRGADRLSIAVPNGTVFAGPGPDRIRAVGRNSIAWGGLGSDRIAVGGTDSVGAGGPGRDRIVAVGPGRKLVWGGQDPDTLVGGPGNTLINAQDGQGGDRVICRSSANRVMLDAGDVTQGPCTVIAAG